MNKGLFSLIISSLLVLTVSGCSGGGSDEPNNEEPIRQEKLTIKGVVTDAPIANAIVSTKIFGTAYETTADESGNYSFDIEFNEGADTDNEFIILSAKGVSNQGFVVLKTAIVSVSELINNAGGDKVVDDTEYKALEINQVTTAMLGLSIEENGGVLPQTSAEFQTALKNLGGNEILNAAAVIKLIVDYSDSDSEVSLPEGITNTWELVENERVLREYFIGLPSTLDPLFSEVLEDTIQQMKGSSNYSSIPSFYTHLSGGLSYITKKADFDKGIYLEENVEQQANTYLAGGKISSALEGKVTSVSFPSKDVGGYSVQFTEETVITDKEYGLVQEFETFDLVVERTQGFYHYENPEYPDYYPDEPFDRSTLAVMAKSASPIEASEVPATQMLPLNAEMLNDTITYDTSYGQLNNSITKLGGSFTLNANGTVTGAHSELGGGSWEINNESNLVLNLANASLVVEKYREDFVGVTIRDLAGKVLGFTTGYTGKRAQSTLWTEENVVGFYDLPANLFGYELSFVLHLKSDGSGDWLSGYDNNGNGVAEADEYNKEPLLWHLEDGLLVVERYTDLNLDGCLPGTGVPDCFLLNRREIDLFQIEGDRFYVTNNHKFNYHPLFFLEVTEELEGLWYFETLATRYWNKYSEFPLELDL